MECLSSLIGRDRLLQSAFKALYLLSHSHHPAARLDSIPAISLDLSDVQPVTWPPLRQRRCVRLSLPNTLLVAYGPLLHAPCSCIHSLRCHLRLKHRNSPKASYKFRRKFCLVSPSSGKTFLEAIILVLCGPSHSLYIFYLTASLITIRPVRKSINVDFQ